MQNVYKIYVLENKFDGDVGLCKNENKFYVLENKFYVLEKKFYVLENKFDGDVGLCRMRTSSMF